MHKEHSYALLIQSFQVLCSAYIDDMAVYSEEGHREGGGGGNWGILSRAPLCSWAPKDRYTLIEQSNTLLSWAPQALLAALMVIPGKDTSNMYIHLLLLRLMEAM